MENNQFIFSPYNMFTASYLTPEQYFYGTIDQLSIQINKQHEEIYQLKKENEELKLLLNQFQTEKITK